MILSEFEKIIEICYTKKIVPVIRRKKQVIIEQELSALEILQIIADEFGFILEDENKDEE